MVASARSPATAQTPTVWGGFLVLPENRSAVRSAHRLVKRLGRRKIPSDAFTDPLVWHGPPGSGKSALAVALIHRVIEADAGRSARLVPAGELPRRNADRDPAAGPDDFAEMLLCDLLVIEDLQHLPAKRVASLCRIMDYRAARRRPTVFTASLGPARLNELSRRLTSRLAGGLVIRLDPPSQASRRVLAQEFARERGPRPSPAAADWLAERYPGGARPLHGAVEQLRSLAKPGGLPLSATAVAGHLAGSTADEGGHSPMDRIVNRVSDTFGVRARDVVGSGRQRGVMVPRQVAMYLSRLVAKQPLSRIGAHFGGRDHTTVMHALRKVEETLRDDAELAGTIRELQASLE